MEYKDFVAKEKTQVSNNGSGLETETRDLIDLFNSQFNVETLLLSSGYSQEVGSGRWLHPNSTSGIAGLKLFDDGKWWSYNSTDPLCTGTPIDNFDIFRLLVHSGDWGQAFNEARKVTGFVRPADEWNLDTAPTVDQGVVEVEENEFPILTLHQLINQPPKQWFVNKLFGRDDIIMMFGDAGSGKSFISLDMALDCIRGVPLMQNSDFSMAEPIRVLIMTNEGINSYGERTEAMIDYKKIPSQGEVADRLRVATEMLNLFEMNGTELWDINVTLEDGKRVQTPYKTVFGKFVQSLGDWIPDLIIIDTQQNATVGADENSNKDANIVIQNAKTLKSFFSDCAIMLIHHTNKQSGTYRGASAYKGHMDAMFLVESQTDKGDIAGSNIYHYKSKHGQAQKAMYCERKEHEGFDYPILEYTAVGEAINQKETNQEDNILGLLFTHPKSTIRYISDVLSIPLNTTKTRVTNLVHIERIIKELKNPDKDSSPHNPYLYSLNEQGFDVKPNC